MTPPAPAALRRIAHDALCLVEPPYLKYYAGRFGTWNGVTLVGMPLPGPGFNFAAVLRPDAPPLDELLPVAREFFATAEKGWGVLVEGDAGHPVEAQLRARGWAVDEDEPAYVMEELPTGPGAAGPPELAIRVVATQADCDACKAVTAAAFDAPPELTEGMMPTPEFARDPAVGQFVGSVGGADVCAVGYTRSGPTAVIAGTATLEAYRGRGYGAAITRAALAHAAGRGCTSAALRSGPKSIPLYECLGFRYVCQHRTYAAPADS
jgi:GNAT superfamily N-acetyltransferase